MKILITNIQAKVAGRPPGYLDDCLAHGIIDGDWIEFTDDVWRQLCRKYRVIDPTRESMAENYHVATASARTRGFEIVHEDIYKQRRAVCDGCEHNQTEQCQVCGNYPVRLYWRHAKCPRAKWE